uniref:Rhomboid-like protein 15 n=1 Tax=Tanacetum cinerariifolium TaxID=118510 RepID=A0A6L2MEN1_TANCI|nr:rhomboid-like protein 15 [Tanacetum cinerariifolium]
MAELVFLDATERGISPENSRFPRRGRTFAATQTETVPANTSLQGKLLESGNSPIHPAVQKAISAGQQKMIEVVISYVNATIDTTAIGFKRRLLIKNQLVTHLTLSITLRAVLDALRKPVDSKVTTKLWVGSALNIKTLVTTVERRETPIEGREKVPSLAWSPYMKLLKGLKHEVEHGKAKVDLAAIEAYNPEADTKYIAALHALKDLMYPLVDQPEKLKDAPIDVIMSSLYFESYSGEDAPQLIRELRHSSSQLKIPVYPEVRNPKDPWSFKEEILLEDAIGANISRAKKKKCRWCAVPMGLVPPTMPATQTDITKDEASPKLLRSKYPW